MKKLIPIAIVLLMGMSAAAHADFYVGASYLSTDAEFETAFEDFDTDDSSYKFFAGFNFAKFFGIEASYRDLGTHQQTVGLNMIDLDLDAIDLSARAKLDIGKRLTVFAKAGYANIGASGSFDFDGVPEDIDEDEWELIYGVGVDVNLGGRFGLRAEWEEYDIDDTLNSFSAGVFFRF
jgi:OOP family OmpA-OmpF porin